MAGADGILLAFSWILFDGFSLLYVVSTDHKLVRKSDCGILLSTQDNCPSVAVIKAMGPAEPYRKHQTAEQTQYKILLNFSSTNFI